jgi:hypothetical protein
MLYSLCDRLRLAGDGPRPGRGLVADRNRDSLNGRHRRRTRAVRR